METAMKEVMTIPEFADATGLKRNSVRKLYSENKLYSMKVGNRIYINYPKSIQCIWQKPTE